MGKIRKEFIIVGLVAFLIFAAVIVYKRIKKSASLYRGKDVSTVKSTPAPATGLCSKGDVWPVSYGVCGSKALMVQKAMNKKRPAAGLDEDGKFGSLSVAELALQTGQKSISEKEFTKLFASPNNTTEVNLNTSPVAYPSNLDELAIDVKTDIDLWYGWGRSEAVPAWSKLDLLNSTDLALLADRYRAIFNRSLYSDIDNARFAPTTDIDVRLLNKLTAAGKTA